MADKLTAVKAKQLRDKLVSECNRRNGYGSLLNYMDKGEHQWHGNDNSSTAAGYPATPRIGDLITAAQGRVIIEPLLQIRDVGDLNLDGLYRGQQIPKSFNSDLLGYVDQLANESMYGNYTSCRSMCTGLCKGTCISTCNGCSAACGGACESGCSKTCGTSCGSCSNQCTGTCYSNCTGDCRSGCSGCSSNCSSSCGSNCLGSST